ncbi:DUF4123 domain-containing protein [Pseudomonas sp. MT3]
MSPHDTAMFPSLPANLPWGQVAALLLDGVTVESLLPKLYEWSSSPTVWPLYMHTRWKDLIDLSPCLIRLRGPDDPILLRFLNNAPQEWGYLIFSDLDWPSLTARMSWLASVRHPTGEEALLRLADPAVAHALAGVAERNRDPDWFGPCSTLVIPDERSDCWHLHRRPGPWTSVPPPRVPYQLGDAQIASLEEVSFRATVKELDEHMRQFFPGYTAGLPRSERWLHLNSLTSAAYESGFCSPHDITLYANIHGFLGPQALDDHPDIRELLAETANQNPSQRLETAAHRAMERAASLSGRQG